MTPRLTINLNLLSLILSMFLNILLVSTESIFEFELISFEEPTIKDPLQLSICLNSNCKDLNVSSVVINSPLKIPVTFRWMKSFTLSVNVFTIQDGRQQFVLKKEEFEDGVVPSNKSQSFNNWIYKKVSTNTLQLIYRYRVYCGFNYYGDDCSLLCSPRNDFHGHYVCLPNGQKQCLPGWKGMECNVPKCAAGCNPFHGTCNEPGECICKHGYKGENCNECIPYPGCKNGFCLKPWDCVCHRKWGGFLCDQDLDYCSHHKPCLNGATCDPITPNNYKCNCKDGYGGKNCQLIVNPCVTSPCLNNGHCQRRSNSTYACRCPSGFRGSHCEENINDCLSNPCVNGALCQDLVNDVKCLCPKGLTGKHCELDIDECNLPLSLPLLRLPAGHQQRSVGKTPCNPKTTEVCVNTFGSFECICKKGFTGETCEKNIDDCKSNACANGGQCVDLVNSYRCDCQPGFKGSHCQTIDHDVCRSKEQFWKVKEQSSNCSSAKWCKCSVDTHKPYCLCLNKSVSFRTESGTEMMETMRNPSLSSLRIIFEESNLSLTDSVDICVALEAILTLMGRNLNQLHLICTPDSSQSVVFYSTKETGAEEVLNLGDIILQLKEFRIKQIIKQRPSMVSTTTSSSSVASFIFIVVFSGVIISVLTFLRSVHRKRQQRENLSAIKQIHNNLIKNNVVQFNQDNLNIIKSDSIENNMNKDDHHHRCSKPTPQTPLALNKDFLPSYSSSSDTSPSTSPPDIKGSSYKRESPKTNLSPTKILNNRLCEHRV